MRQAHTENTRRKTSRGVESSENAYPRLPVNGHPGGVALGVASVHLGVARTLEVGTPRLIRSSGELVRVHGHVDGERLLNDGHPRRKRGSILPVKSRALEACRRSKTVVEALQLRGAWELCCSTWCLEVDELSCLIPIDGR